MHDMLHFFRDAYSDQLVDIIHFILDNSKYYGLMKIVLKIENDIQLKTGTIQSIHRNKNLNTLIMDKGWNSEAKYFVQACCEKLLS